MAETVSTAPEIDQAVERAGEANVVLILDLDETVFHTLKKHVRILRTALKMSGVKEELIPTLEEAMAGGGTKVFERIFDKNEAGEDVPEFKGKYAQINEVMRNAQPFNHHIPLIDENTPAILAQTAEADYPTIMFLTTRPDDVAPVTQIDLARLNLPDAPVLARPTTVDVKHTTEWKLDILTKIAEKIPGTVVMVDDSPALIKTIKELDNPKIIGLLFQGPQTPTDTGLPSTNWTDFIQSVKAITASIS